jgi:hypothetical protein
VLAALRQVHLTVKADPPVRHGPNLHWTRTVAGKTVTRTLTQDQAPRSQAWFDNARPVRDLLSDLEARFLRAFEDAAGWPEKGRDFAEERWPTSVQ